MFLNISLNFLPFMRNRFSFSFFFVLLFVENYRTNKFLINFVNEPSFFVIPKILFLLIHFIFVPMMVTSNVIASYIYYIIM